MITSNCKGQIIEVHTVSTGLKTTTVQISAQWSAPKFKKKTETVPTLMYRMLVIQEILQILPITESSPEKWN